MTSMRVPIVSVVVGCCLAGAAHGVAKRPSAGSRMGVVLETKYVHVKRSFSGLIEQKGALTITIGANGVRMESPNSKVVDLFTYEKAKDGKPRDVWYYINRNNRTYEKRDLAQRREEDARLREAMNKRARNRPRGGGLFGALSQLPQDASRAPGGEVKTERTGTKSKIAGIACEHVRFTQGGTVVCEVWVAAKLKRTRSLRHLAAGRKLLLENTEGKNNKKLVAARLALDGVELKSVLHRPAGQRYVIETTKVTEKNVPAATFKPPAGHRKVDRVKLFGPGS